MPIQKINHGSTQGYQVRVGPRDAALTKFFALRKYGGAKKALALARAAEAQLQKIAPPTAARSGARRTTHANNTSGLVGIRPRFEVFSEHPYLYFVASWSVRGKACSAGYSAEKHGRLGALKMAMERREKATGARYDLTARQAWNRMKYLVASR